ncbi:MAG: PQQ-like beta-propeller repeat protein, partial [Ekhidna sp.]|nr:PQQ-like beta-propeller repeat protein [Ekhidna sp.]
MNNRRIHYLLSLLMFIAISCNKILEDEIEVDQPNQELAFDNEFDFSTKKELTLNTNRSTNPFSMYFKDTQGNEHLFGSFVNNGRDVMVTIPSYVTDLIYEERGTNASIRSNLVVGQQQSQVALPMMDATNSSCIDRLYAVNGQAGFYEIDVTSDDYLTTSLPDLPGGSIANALDQENGIVYINVHKTLYKYHVDTESFEVAFTRNPYNGQYPRFEYKNGIFYMGNSNSMYTVDAETNAVIQRYDISGFVNSNAGGDLAFDSEGTLYLACFSGLYKFISLDDVNGVATISRISAENFPFQLTSMAIDRQDRIFVGTNDASSRLIEISKEDGSYQIVKTYNHKINDLTAWKCDFTNSGGGGSSDNDGDGVL